MEKHVTGWWFQPSEKYEFVSWDDDIPNIWKFIKAMFQTTNQDMSNLAHDIHSQIFPGVEWSEKIPFPSRPVAARVFCTWWDWSAVPRCLTIE